MTGDMFCRLVGHGAEDAAFGEGDEGGAMEFGGEFGCGFLQLLDGGVSGDLPHGGEFLGVHFVAEGREVTEAAAAVGDHELVRV